MAKIKKNSDVTQQAPAMIAWSPAELMAMLREARTGDRAEALKSLKRSGILTKSGKLARRFRSWGNKVSRTPTAEEMGITVK